MSITMITPYVTQKILPFSINISIESISRGFKLQQLIILLARVIFLFDNILRAFF